jgi:hypothetical protein
MRVLGGVAGCKVTSYLREVVAKGGRRAQDGPISGHGPNTIAGSPDGLANTFEPGNRVGVMPLAPTGLHDVFVARIRATCSVIASRADVLPTSLIRPRP